MTIFEHLDAETDIQELLKMSPTLLVELEAQSIALRVLGLYSIAKGMSEEGLQHYVENARKYVQQLIGIGAVKNNLRSIDCSSGGAVLPQPEKYVYEQASDMAQFYRWLAALSPAELRFVMSSCADNVQFAHEHTDIIEIINDSLAKKTHNPLLDVVADTCHSWLSIMWAAPTRSTLRRAWPRKALNSLFEY